MLSAPLMSADPSLWQQVLQVHAEAFSARVRLPAAGGCPLLRPYIAEPWWLKRSSAPRATLQRSFALLRSARKRLCHAFSGGGVVRTTSCRCGCLLLLTQTLASRPMQLTQGMTFVLIHHRLGSVWRRSYQAPRNTATKFALNRKVQVVAPAMHKAFRLADLHNNI